MKIVDFIKRYAERPYIKTDIRFLWSWTDTGIDEEYSFEGSAVEFVEKYTKDYDCLASYELDDLYLLIVVKGRSISIQMELVVD